jgi:hypothetical protein
VSDTPRTDAGLEYDDTTVDDVKDFARTLERELNATNAEIRSLQYNIDRVMGMYASKDNQICNLLNICRANGIDVSSQDLIHGKEDKL